MTEIAMAQTEPEQWRAVACSGLHEFMVVTDRWTVAEICGEHDRAAAYANLIATAPALVAVCEKYIAWWERAANRECHGAIVEQMTAAIAKAKSQEVPHAP